MGHATPDPTGHLKTHGLPPRSPERFPSGGAPEIIEDGYAKSLPAWLTGGVNKVSQWVDSVLTKRAR